jgi:hypothetical protein
MRLWENVTAEVFPLDSLLGSMGSAGRAFQGAQDPVAVFDPLFGMILCGYRGGGASCWWFSERQWQSPAPACMLHVVALFHCPQCLAAVGDAGHYPFSSDPAPLTLHARLDVSGWEC